MGCKKDCNFGCIIAIVISIIVAILAGVFFAGATASLLPLLYTIIIGAVLILAVLIIVALMSCKKDDKCVCKYGSCLLIGTLGAIITSVATIYVLEFTTILAVLFGIVIFFAVLAVLEFFGFVNCLIKEDCKYSC